MEAYGGQAVTLNSGVHTQVSPRGGFVMNRMTLDTDFCPGNSAYPRHIMLQIHLLVCH